MSNVSLNSTLGAFVIGAVLGNILFGITCLQSSLYYGNYPNDGLNTDDVADDEQVGIIWVLDTIDIAATTHVWYFYSVKNFGDVQAFTQGTIVWSFKLHILICGVCAMLMETYIHIQLVGKHFYNATGILWFIVVGYLSVPSFSQTPSIRNALISLFSTSVAAEFILSVAMIYILNKGRTASVFPGIIATLVTLMQLVLISGLATSLYSMFILVAVLSMFVVWPDTLIFFGVDCLQPKIFINSLLAMLNARKMIRNVDQSIRLQTSDSSGLAPECVRDHCRKDKLVDRLLSVMRQLDYTSPAHRGKGITGLVMNGRTIMNEIKKGRAPPHPRKRVRSGFSGVRKKNWKGIM
ncbi:uncharacterized protein BT62DRAFT_923475 [Guyanagaster necrorhizus]|uniref:DUF6534 domain-containing protein n=1 Tax=Guyanagaster necrorhizus TaxID=856835 RepID=A0A9P7VJ15_9AGAR|nr:uncharacterized protein BT62DRAFT_923475 [Guyanagaster necrorhizus MCA 3950]KAG7441255.1 hypothetical protein BT62DRAFT_923475 [Guyanagaster necrorhizus MCA 3950]